MSSFPPEGRKIRSCRSCRSSGVAELLRTLTCLWILILPLQRDDRIRLCDQSIRRRSFPPATPATSATPDFLFWRSDSQATKIQPMKKALVAGALGVTGRTLVNHLISLGDWEVIGLSRRSPEFQTTAQFIAVDLLDRTEVESRLRMVGDITHIFYAALQPAANFFDEVAPNLTMLTNLVETVERSSTAYFFVAF